MQLTDAQVHIWGANTPERPWPSGDQVHPQREIPLGKDELLQAMDEAGVNRAVLVPPSWEGIYNDLVLEAAAAHPARFAAMGRVDLQQPRSLRDWLAQPGMLGVRTIFYLPAQRPWLSDGTAEWLWKEAEEHAIPMMSFSPGQTASYGDIARRHPAMRLVIDHCNLGLDVKDDAIGPELEPLLALADQANIAVKISSLPSFVTESYPFRSLHGHIKSIIDAFGVQRCMWGSDLTRLTCPYRQWLQVILEELDFLDDHDRAMLLGGTLENWLNWPAEP